MPPATAEQDGNAGTPSALALFASRLSRRRFGDEDLRVLEAALSAGADVSALLATRSAARRLLRASAAEAFASTATGSSGSGLAVADFFARAFAVVGDVEMLKKLSKQLNLEGRGGMDRGKEKLPGDLHRGFKPEKCKALLKMAVAQIKQLVEEKEVAVRQMRREVAELLQPSKDQATAISSVDHVIREENLIQAYNLIEQCCDDIVANFSIINSQMACPMELKDQIDSILFASTMCPNVSVLVDIQKQFSSKYGEEFIADALKVRRDTDVALITTLVMEKLSARAPDVQNNIKTLTSIAEEHNIRMDPNVVKEKLQKPHEGLKHGLNMSSMSISLSELMHTTILAELYKEDLEEAEKIIQQKDHIVESQNATIKQLEAREASVEVKVWNAKIVFCACTRKSKCTTVQCSCKASNVLCCAECTCKTLCVNKERPLQRPGEKAGATSSGHPYPLRVRKKENIKG